MAKELESGWRAAVAWEVATGAERSVALAEEVPVALSVGGIAHAVMMASPSDLIDFAIGFALTDGVIDGIDAVRDVTFATRNDGTAIEITLNGSAFQRFLATRRRRSLRVHSSCGVCGVVALDDVPRAARVRTRAGITPSFAAVRLAADSLRGFQTIGAATRATHCAALASTRGDILIAREDVGRHNALDKLVGAAIRAGVSLAEGFVLLSSRCSLEMVQKAVAGGAATLVALSSPTSLAVREADAAGLRLIGNAASVSPVLYTAATTDTHFGAMRATTA